MEERYQIAARQDMQQVLQASSSTLKLLISRNAAAFQGKCVLRSETKEQQWCVAAHGCYYGEVDWLSFLVFMYCLQYNINIL